MNKAEYKKEIYSIETIYVYDELISIYKGNLLETKSIKVRLSEVKILSLFGVVKSLKEKRKLHFGEWKQSKGLRYMSGHTYKDSDGDLYDADEVEKMYQTYYDSF